MLTRTSIVTGSPFATVSSSGASDVPSEYGLGGASTRIESRSSPIRVAAADAVERARSGRPCQVAEVGRNAACRSGSNVASTVAPTPVSGTAAERRSSTSARISRTDSSTAGGMSRLPACNGSAGRRAPPGVVGPAATTSARPLACIRPESSSRSTAASSARAPVASVLHTCGGATTTGCPSASWERNTRVATASWVASGGLAAAGTVVTAPATARVGVSGAAVARANRGSVSTPSSDDVPTTRGTAPPVSPVAPPSTAPASSTTARAPPAATVSSAGSSSTPPLGHVVASSTGVPRASVTTAPASATAMPPRSASCPRASATRSASAKGSATTQPSRAAAPSVSSQVPATSAPVPGTVPVGPRTAYPCRIAAAVATRSGSTARQVASRTGEPAGAPSANAVSSPPRRPCGASDRASSSSTSSVCSPGTVGSRCGVSTRG